MSLTAMYMHDSINRTWAATIQNNMRSIVCKLVNWCFHLCNFHRTQQLKTFGNYCLERCNVITNTKDSKPR